MQTNSQLKAVIWSKNNCVACGSAKMMLGQLGYTIEERNIDGPQWSRIDLLDKYPQARSVPVIELNDGEFIGNLDTVRKHLDRAKETKVE